MLTQKQIQDRKNSIGASDSAAICGLNPFRNAYDVFCEKTGRVQPFAGNDATRAGDRLEQTVIEWALDTLKPTAHVRSPIQLVNGIMSAHLDCSAILADGAACVIEGKTSGITSRLSHEDWGEEGTDEVPDQYKIQVQQQLFVAGPEYQRGYLAALIPPRGFCLFVIDRDEEAIDAIKETCESFWANHVLADTPPEGVPSIDTIKRMTRKALSEVNLPAELIEAWELAKANAKVAEGAADEAKLAVLIALGQAERGIYPGGEVTFLEQRRKEFVQKETTFRVLRHKRAKGML